jgi:hypothetical protein
LVYPNPADGTKPIHIHVQGIVGTADVRVEIFTTAFRKIQDVTFPKVPAGTDVEISLVDRGGNHLANGLYYVRVQSNGGRQIIKLLILR